MQSFSPEAMAFDRERERGSEQKIDTLQAFELLREEIGQRYAEEKEKERITN